MINIGALSQRTGVNIETIRYYEKSGLLPSPARTQGGFRQYEDRHVQRLRFIRRGRDLGFSIESIRALLGLAEQPEHRCGDADRIASEHLAAIERKIEELGRLRDALNAMANCRADRVAECRIIEALAS